MTSEPRSLIRCWFFGDFPMGFYNAFFFQFMTILWCFVLQRTLHTPTHRWLI